jgi:hypothetical protein
MMSNEQDQVKVSRKFEDQSLRTIISIPIHATNFGLIVPI